MKKSFIFPSAELLNKDVDDMSQDNRFSFTGYCKSLFLTRA